MITSPVADLGLFTTRNPKIIHIYPPVLVLLFCCCECCFEMMLRALLMFIFDFDFVVDVYAAVAVFVDVDGALLKMLLLVPATAALLSQLLNSLSRVPQSLYYVCLLLSSISTGNPSSTLFAEGGKPLASRYNSSPQPIAFTAPSSVVFQPDWDDRSRYCLYYRLGTVVIWDESRLCGLCSIQCLGTCLIRIGSFFKSLASLEKKRKTVENGYHGFGVKAVLKDITSPTIITKCTLT